MEAFELLGTIGEGTYGVVLKARHKESGQIVAIKKFKASEQDEQVRKTALREVRILRQLRQENIVSLIEVFRRKKRLYLVFEYVESTLLEELERRPEGLDPLNVKKIMWQLIRGVDYLHSHQVIHRDVKPENLLLSRSGILKLCDFGFARTLAGPGARYTDYVSTRWYRCPELLIGDTSYGKAVDIWAIGCLMAERESDVDQLFHIMRTLGGLTPRMVELVKRNSLFTGVRLPEIIEADSLDRKLVGLDPLALDVIKSCLRYEPLQRTTTADILRHPYFAGLEEWYLPEYHAALEKDAAVNILGRRAAAAAANVSTASASGRSGQLGASKMVVTTDNKSVDLRAAAEREDSSGSKASTAASVTLLAPATRPPEKESVKAGAFSGSHGAHALQASPVRLNQLGSKATPLSTGTSPASVASFMGGLAHSSSTASLAGGLFTSELSPGQGSRAGDALTGVAQGLGDGLGLDEGGSRSRAGSNMGDFELFDGNASVISEASQHPGAYRKSDRNLDERGGAHKSLLPSSSPLGAAIANAEAARAASTIPSYAAAQASSIFSSEKRGTDATLSQLKQRAIVTGGVNAASTPSNAAAAGAGRRGGATGTPSLEAIYNSGPGAVAGALLGGTRRGMNAALAHPLPRGRGTYDTWDSKDSEPENAENIDLRAQYDGGARARSPDAKEDETVGARGVGAAWNRRTAVGDGDWAADESAPLPRSRLILPVATADGPRGSPIHGVTGASGLGGVYSGGEVNDEDIERALSESLRGLKTLGGSSGDARSSSLLRGGGGSSSFAAPALVSGGWRERPRPDGKEIEPSDGRSVVGGESMGVGRSLSVERTRAPAGYAMSLNNFGGFQRGAAGLAGHFSQQGGGADAAGDIDDRGGASSSHLLGGDDSLYEALVSELSKGAGTGGKRQSGVVQPAAPGAQNYDARRMLLPSREGRDRERSLLQSRGALLVGLGGDGAGGGSGGGGAVANSDARPGRSSHGYTGGGGGGAAGIAPSSIPNFSSSSGQQQHFSLSGQFSMRAAGGVAAAQPSHAAMTGNLRRANPDQTRLLASSHSGNGGGGSGGAALTGGRAAPSQLQGSLNLRAAAGAGPAPAGAHLRGAGGGGLAAPRGSVATGALSMRRN